MTLTQTSFERIYKVENIVKAKVRILLVPNVAYQHIVTARIAKDFREIDPGLLTN
ncbi:MAG: hypothetical protein P0116_15790 [Candidatus Nitrosocosmicus sp.]|nr:hypothetical protein [Candidatus Nitrosocosmicus sp.]